MLVLRQFAFDVKTAETVSLFLRTAVVKRLLFVPDAVLLMNHWMPGLVPPLVVVAVNVTEVPEQIAPDVLLVMLSDGLIELLTTIIVLVEVAVTGEAQEAVDVITTDIASLLVSVLLEKVLLVAPVTFAPLILHWYPGVVPPLVGFAVNVAKAPAQIVVVGVVIATDGTMLELVVTIGVVVMATLAQPGIEAIMLSV